MRTLGMPEILVGGVEDLAGVWDEGGYVEENECRWAEGGRIG
jgi:hypothetical protein